MRGIYKLVTYLFTVFCKIFTTIKICRVYIIYSQLCVDFFLFGNTVRDQILAVSAEDLYEGVAFKLKTVVKHVLLIHAIYGR